MASSKELTVVLARLRALQQQLPDPEIKAGTDLQLPTKLNSLVERAGSITGNDYSEFLVGDEAVTSRGQLLGLGRTQLPGKVVNLALVRNSLADLIATLEAEHDLQPATSAPPAGTIQLVVNTGNDNQYSVALAGGDVTQDISFTGTSGDIGELVRLLRELEVPDLLVDDLEEELGGAGDDVDRRRKAAWRWVRSFISTVASNAAGDVLAQRAPVVVSAIIGFLGAYA